VKYFNRGVSAAESWSPSIKGRIGISALEKWRIGISAPQEGM